MKASTAKRYALFFILLALGQEFSLARYSPQSRFSEIDRTIVNGQDLPKDFELEQDEDEEKELELFDQDRQKEKEEERGLQPHKRFSIALAVLTTQVIFSAANLALEIAYKIGSCCVTHPKACDYRNEFNAVKKRIEPMSAEIDKIASKSVKLREDIVLCNYQLNAVWNEMKTINTYEEAIVRILLPPVTKLFKNKLDEIKRQLENKNKTVQQFTYDDLGNQFQSVFNDYESTLMAMSSWVGYGLMAAGLVAFRAYKNNQISKLINELSTGQSYKQLVMARHTRAAKVMGIDKVGLNRFITETATNKINSKYSGTKMAKAVNGINILAGLLTAGFDVYAIILKIQQCDAIQDNAHKALVKIREAEVDIKEVKENVTNYYNYLRDEGWIFITNQTTNVTLHKSLEDIRDLVINADHKTTALNNAISSINTYLKNINSSKLDTNRTFSLLKDLATGLHAITFKMKCYENKILLINHVSEMCRNGTNDLQTLYTSGLSSFGIAGDTCIIDDKGTPYTSFEKFNATIANIAAAQNYSVDCKLNNPLRQTQACTYKQQGFSVTKIGKKMDLTDEQVQFFLDKCPPPSLLPKDKENICMFKNGHGWTAKQILPFMTKGVTLESVQDYMDNGACPPVDV